MRYGRPMRPSYGETACRAGTRRCNYSATSPALHRPCGLNQLTGPALCAWPTTRLGHVVHVLAEAGEAGCSGEAEVRRARTRSPCCTATRSGCRAWRSSCPASSRVEMTSAPTRPPPGPVSPGFGGVRRRRRVAARGRVAAPAELGLVERDHEHAAGLVRGRREDLRHPRLAGTRRPRRARPGGRPCTARRGRRRTRSA